MFMLETMKKIPIIDIIVGTLFIFLGILFVYIKPEVGENIKNVAIGLMILLIVGLLVYPSFKKSNSKLLLSLLVLEFVIVILVSIIFIANKTANPSLWIGLVIYIHGVVGLIGGYFSSEKQNMWLFFLSLLFVTIGVFIFGSKLITNDMLLIVLLLLFVVPGVFLLVLGLINLKRKFPTKASS